MRFLQLIFVSLVTISCVSAQGTKKYPPDIQGAREEVYKTVDDLSLKLWVFEPKDHQPTDQRAAIVFFFGGGWNSGTPTQFQNHCRYLAEQGMVAMVADYRVRSRNKTLAVSCVEDAESAVRYIRQNAKRLGIDPLRIAAGGGSAGGHLAACTGVVPVVSKANQAQSSVEAQSSTDADVSSRPNAMVLFNPAMILAPFDGVALDAEKMGQMKARLGVEPVALSPIHHVNDKLPPTIIFHGTQDKTVPFSTVQRYAEVATKAGNRCELKAYSGEGHGFFNFGRGGKPGENYQRTVHQMHVFLKSLGYLENPPPFDVPVSTNVHVRSNLAHSRQAFEGGQGTVAFMGGSITENPGYRDLVAEYLRKRFPDTKFQFVAAGISSTCSTTGAFRLQRDVLSQNPDLFFVEFAVNDDQDAVHANRECIRGMEGVVRHALEHDPTMDIVVTHFVNPPILNKLRSGETPVSVAAHERVAAHYGVSTINVAKEVADRISAGTLTWKEYGGTHPKPLGYRIAGGLMVDLLDTAWARETTNAEPEKTTLPKPIDRFSYARGRFVDGENAKTDEAWSFGLPAWKQIPGSLRSRFEDRELLTAEQAGAELTFKFEGSGVGLYTLAGPDAGMIEYAIDGKAFKKLDLYHRFSKSLHYPRTVMLAGELDDKPHQLTLRISEDKNPKSQGHAVRILKFTVN